MAAAPELNQVAEGLSRSLGPRGACAPALRSHARAALDAGLSWPSRKHEAWRHTPIDALKGTIWRPALASTPQEPEVPAAVFDVPGPRLVFVDGQLNQNLSLLPPAQPGVWVGSLAQAYATEPDRLAATSATNGLHTQLGLAALNAAAWQDGALVHVDADVQLGAPLHLVYVQTGHSSTPGVVQPRTLVLAGARSELAVWEHYMGAGDGVRWTNAVTEMTLSPGAQVQHVVLQDESAATRHTGALAAQVQANAKLTAFVLSAGGAQARREMHVTLAGEGAETTLGGLYLAGASTHHDLQVALHHQRPHTRSVQNFRGILRDHATGVFSGTVYVAPGAIQTDAQQLCRSLLLSAQAQVHAQPRLEILADDVKCAHGATVGQLDAEALFYLQSRGHDAQTAQRLLTYAFAADVLRDAPRTAHAALLKRVQQHLGVTDLEAGV
jgi:Fe-S cluster assembly protein SufD